ncbi:MAG TPA: DUF190 domain-containing protein [Acidimicrobiales bacterium]|nr:DUF190 domain-containing protein [Acidimicrobiales bacterium]
MPEDNGPARLMAFLNEDDTFERKPLGEVLLDLAGQAGLADAETIRGVEGYGRSGRIRSDRSPDALTGLPIVFQAVGDRATIATLARAVSAMAPDRLVTMEPAPPAETASAH